MLTATLSREPMRPVLPSLAEDADRTERTVHLTEALARPAPAHVLLLDDEPGGLADQLRRAFPAPGYRVQVARAGGFRNVTAGSPDVVVIDPGLSGLDTYQQIRRLAPSVPVIFVTGVKRADAAIEAMKQGAHDVLFKPVELLELRRVVGEALDVARTARGATGALETGSEPEAGGPLVGSCPAMGEVYKSVGRVAAQDVPVLVTGESGTGKELVARAIWQHSKRADQPFLALNCAAIPENLLESELFGHEKGAFTGADRKRIGKFEQCHGGTLFLDEIGDMPPALQAKILRLLQDQTFERVGGSETVRTDVRIISATHRDLKARAAEGLFREDLYYRLGVFTIHLPPLRERGDDLPLLVRHFVQRFGRELGRDVREVSAEALAALRAYSWPGNLRELQSALKQALLRASGPVLLPAMLPDLTAGPAPQSAVGASTDQLGLEELIRKRFADGSEDLHNEVNREVDRILLPLVMEYTRGNQFQAAKVLGVSRQTLRRRLRELHITPRFGDGTEDAADRPQPVL